MFGKKKKEQPGIPPEDYIVGFWILDTSYTDDDFANYSYFNENINDAHLLYAKSSGNILTDIFDEPMNGTWRVSQKKNPELGDEYVAFDITLKTYQETQKGSAYIREEGNLLRMMLCFESSYQPHTYTLVRGFEF